MWPRFSGLVAMPLDRDTKTRYLPTQFRRTGKEPCSARQSLSHPENIQAEQGDLTGQARVSSGSSLFPCWPSWEKRGDTRVLPAALHPTGLQRRRARAQTHASPDALAVSLSGQYSSRQPWVAHPRLHSPWETQMWATADVLEPGVSDGTIVIIGKIKLCDILENQPVQLLKRKK